MIVNSLRLKNFRNYKSLSLSFCDGVNCVYGANAQGKTNLLESLFLLISGRSFRTSQLKDLIGENEQYFSVEIDFVKYGVEQTLRYVADGKQRRLWHNSTNLSSLSALVGILQGALLAPLDLQLIKGTPQHRRHFLDLQLSQSDPLYLHHLTRYFRALRQRNHLLKQKYVMGIEVWEEQMAVAAAYLFAQRATALELLGKEAERINCCLSASKDSLELRYKTVVDPQLSEEKLSCVYLEQLQRTRQKDLTFGSSSIGPHRDDVQVFIQGRDARYFASEGQQHCVVAALRLAEWYLLSGRSEELPLMIVDDVGISLDNTRKKALLAELGKLGQVFISLPRLDQHLFDTTESCFFAVESGEIVQEEIYTNC
ncbi:MAG: DNA replication/repair protein RecF [Waddliaceae bacterium]|nr:DNA replication/repair protein RecF [Waddliaceae bacterium]